MIEFLTLLLLTSGISGPEEAGVSGMSRFSEAKIKKEQKK
jgi:hypothetical protein